MDFYMELYNYFNKSKTYTAKIISGENLGAKLLFADGELIYNSLNQIDIGLIASIKKAISSKKSQLITYSENRIFCEPLSKKPSIIICGAGHISIALIKMCKLLDIDVTVIDDRPTFVNGGRQAGADRCICDGFTSALKNIKSYSGTFFIIVTRGHRYDIDCLKEILTKESAYVGMIGSGLRIRRIKENLLKEGFDKDKLDQVYTPMGIKIGAETPEEISISIMAEIIEVKNKILKGSEFPKEILDTIIGEGFENASTALATIISKKGSAPRGVGTKMLIMENGRTLGTIGDGFVEAEIKLLALDVIRDGVPLLKTVDMSGADVESDGMVCSDVVEVFIEPI